MKNIGWQMFLALLIADIIAVVMLALTVKLKIVIIVGLLIFAVLAIVLFFNNRSREKGKKREEEAAAKIATLQDQVEVALSSKNNLNSSVH